MGVYSDPTKCETLLASEDGNRPSQIHELVLILLTAAYDADLRNELYGNVVISRGTISLRLIADRLNNELVHFVPQTFKNRVTIPEDW